MRQSVPSSLTTTQPNFRALLPVCSSKGLFIRLTTQTGSTNTVTIEYRSALPGDAAECIRLRGLTRENAISERRLAELGITTQSWAEDIRSGELPGYICRDGDQMVGYCFGASRTGEIVVLVVVPSHEGHGIARRLLGLASDALAQLGHKRLFLGCSSNPNVRSYGFYRHLGWRSTGEIDQYGDEILEFHLPSSAGVA